MCVYLLFFLHLQLPLQPSFFGFPVCRQFKPFIFFHHFLVIQLAGLVLRTKPFVTDLQRHGATLDRTNKKSKAREDRGRPSREGARPLVTGPATLKRRICDGSGEPAAQPAREHRGAAGLCRTTPAVSSAALPRASGAAPVPLRPRPPRTRFMWSSRNLRSRSSRFCAAAAAAAVLGRASSSEPEP